MSALAFETIGASAREVQDTKGWDAAQISLVSVLGVVFCVFCAILVSSAVFLWRSKRRAKRMAAALDNAKAELGVQRNRAASLERKVSRQDAFIARNVLQGPEAWSATSPEVFPRQRRDSRPVVAQDEDVFVVGIDDESTDGGYEDDNEENYWSAQAVSGGSPRSPVPMSAVRVTQSAIKTIEVKRNRAEDQGVGLTAAALQVQQSHEDFKDAQMAELERVQPFDDQDLGARSQQNDFQAQIDRYWQLEPHYRGSAKAGPDELVTEVKPTTTEAGRGATCAKGGGGKMRGSITSLGGSSRQAGPNTPESSMSPSLPTAPVSGPVSPLKFHGF